MEHLIKEIQSAQRAWDGCDWRHLVPRTVGSDDPTYCEGGVEGCAYCAEVAISAARAIAQGDIAIQGIKDGDLVAATMAIGAAVASEMQWGDAPAWGPVLQAVRR